MSITKPEQIVMPNGAIVELSLDNPLFADFERMPTTFDTFISDPYYFGKSWKDPFPAWKKLGEDMFPLPLRSPYSALVLLGATGIGKTSASVNMIAAYFLHVVLCLRDPHSYFALEEQKNIVFAFLNIVTKTIAYKNAWGMFHKALLQSDFFMEYGYKTQGNKPEWVCNKKPVELLYGSTADHVIGLDILFCLTGDTEIKTGEGWEKLENLVGRSITVETYNQTTKKVEMSTSCTVIPTKTVSELIEIVLENGSIIRCTPEHKFLLATGEYKEAQYLTKEDDLEEGQ